jgi:hypothetical protein
MTVNDLIVELLKHPMHAEVSCSVAWAKDTAVGEGEVTVARPDDVGKGKVVLTDWLSDCGTELE